MRLNEFDNNDRIAHKASDIRNRTIEQRLEEIKSSLRTVENYIDNKVGRKNIIEDQLGNTIDDISDFFDFCNEKSNDDNETRLYLDNLRNLYNKATELLRIIQQ